MVLPSSAPCCFISQSSPVKLTLTEIDIVCIVDSNNSSHYCQHGANFMERNLLVKHLSSHSTHTSKHPVSDTYKCDFNQVIKYRPSKHCCTLPFPFSPQPLCLSVSVSIYPLHFLFLSLLVCWGRVGVSRSSVETVVMKIPNS